MVEVPLTTEEIMRVRELWVKRAQRNIMEMKETPGWRLIRDERSGYTAMSRENPGILSNLFRGKFVCRETYLVHTWKTDAFGSYKHHGSTERNTVDSKDEISCEEIKQNDPILNLTPKKRL